MTNATWLADALRQGGCNVVELAGWQGRGRPGTFGPVRGVLCHHTAGPRTGNAPSLSIIVNGRSDLPGPLSHLHLARDGTFTVIAAGRCNHAGPGIWQGVTSGNTNLIGTEAENAGDGTDPWPDVQMEEYARGMASILKHIGAAANMCGGHKEYALPPGRKIDPSFDMNAFRTRVSAFLGDTGDPVRSTLKFGSRGPDVSFLQSKLGLVEDGAFGGMTDAAVRAFQRLKGILPDGVVGPQTWRALL